MMPDFTQEGTANPAVSPAAPVAPVVYFNGVSKSYGRIHALSGVTLGLSGGVTGILGMNGAGKSTLFKLLMGKLRPSAERSNSSALTLGRTRRRTPRLARPRARENARLDDGTGVCQHFARCTA